ncbi:MAG: fucokinase [Clostridia bacterium]|nr:fucokinase [Clostridia bacterium]
MEKILKLIEEKKPVDNVLAILKTDSLSKAQSEWLESKIGSIDLKTETGFYTAIRLYWYIGSALNDNGYKSKAFEIISDSIIKSDIKCKQFNDSLKIKKDKVVVNLPLRVNWGGGWTDTPPYCLENGGKVLNAAISLNGKLPVEVTIIKIPEKRIIFDSRDMDVYGEFDSIEPLQDTGNPFDSFALQKACLLACGVIPESGSNLTEILDRLGGGFEMHSEVTGVPKGSGLGTSSILAAACVKAVSEFFGIEYIESDLINRVLAMEQIMSTGGGWQDQVGGLVKGIKLISSKKGMNQELKVKNIAISNSAKAELNERFCLIYTGQRRLARNLLRDVVGRYIGNISESVDAHAQIKLLADEMSDALTSDDIDRFAQLLNEHWEFSKKIDVGTTNTLVEQIFLAIEDLIDGRFICGAGGGGFLQVILKKGITKGDVHNRLKSVFQEFPVDVWNCEIIY